MYVQVSVQGAQAVASRAGRRLCTVSNVLKLLCPTGLYLGGLQSLLEAEQIGITHFVVSCVRIMQTSWLPYLMPSVQTVLHNLSALHDSSDFSKYLASEYTRLHISLEDADHANLLPHLDEASSFITQALQGGNRVLVHCAAGISRSATASFYLHSCTQFNCEICNHHGHKESPFLYAATFMPNKQHDQLVL